MNRPPASVAVANCRPVGPWVTTMSAADIGAPAESETSPPIDASVA